VLMVCNIPPVSIGILSVVCVRGLIFQKKVMENIYYEMSAHYVINIRVGFNTFKGKGIMVISP
jgi:hypothetical protein